MRTHRFPRGFIIGLIAVTLINPAAASETDLYFNYLTKVQDAEINVFKALLKEANLEQAAKLKSLGIVFTAAAPGNPNGWCSSPWSTGLRSEYKAKPMVIICPYALSVYADYFTASAIALGSKTKRHDGFAMLEVEKNEKFFAETNEKLARFYLTKVVSSYTRTMHGEANTRCPPSTVAYAVTHDLPLNICGPSDNSKISIWLKSFGMNEDEVNDLWQTAFHEIMSAIIAHEIGHVLQDNLPTPIKLTPVQDEIAADQFAIRIFNTGPKYIARQISLINLEILWSHIAEFSLDTKYPLPPHETTRLEAAVKMSSCEKYRSNKIVDNEAEFAKLAEELTKLFRKYAAVNCDK